MVESNTKRRWWKEGVVYQIYPRSFFDSNGDGIGDLQGIIAKLDYLAWLGVDIVWLNPVYESPNDDNGYDISDYRSILSDFGTMEQFDRLLQGLHERGIRIIMDLVVNHSSDEHPWFIESRSSRESPLRDYYIWRKPGYDGGYPNDWLSFFEGPAWEFDSPTGEYYLHLFSRKQPDLNWENPALRNEVFDIMRFWLDKGVDGFRMDVINLISKKPGLPDSLEVSTSRIRGGEHFINGPEVVNYLSRMNKEVLSGRDVMTVGETPDVTPEIGLQYVGKPEGPLDMLFHFEHMDVDYGPEGYWDIGPWTPGRLFSIIATWQQKMNGKGWNSLYLNNHDQPRQVSRFGDDGVYRTRSAKLLALFLHTLQGTPYIYQGEEIGMSNVTFEDPDQYRDIATRNFYHRALAEGMDKKEIMRRIHYRARDNARTPMQWDGSPHGGFTTGEPWLASNPDYATINVEAQKKEPDSVLHFYRKLTGLRKSHSIFAYGSFRELGGCEGGPIVYSRTLEKEQLLVVLNWGGNDTELSEDLQKKLRIFSGFSLMLSTCEEGSRPRKSPAVLEKLGPWEGLLYSNN
jgi:oligo-1,6-glucosidase